MKACRDCGEKLIVPSWIICQTCTGYKKKRPKEKSEYLYTCNFCEEEKVRSKFSPDEGQKTLTKIKTCNECKLAISNLKKIRYEQW